jgi:type I restriction enzyme S subunit
MKPLPEVLHWIPAFAGMTQVKSVPVELNGEYLLPEFLYYMEQGHVVRWLEQHAVGTTMLNLNTEIVAGLPVRYPAVDTQRRIADTLSAYDDLIENNRRRMALLEEAARQLYREWFVRLRFPGP